MRQNLHLHVTIYACPCTAVHSYMYVYMHIFACVYVCVYVCLYVVRVRARAGVCVCGAALESPRASYPVDKFNTYENRNSRLPLSARLLKRKHFKPDPAVSRPLTQILAEGGGAKRGSTDATTRHHMVP